MKFRMTGEVSSVRSPPSLPPQHSTTIRAENSMSSRRLPIYLLLDCSKGLRKKSLECMRAGLTQLVDELRCNPHAVELVHLSIITYGGETLQLCPLTALTDFKQPTFMTGGDVVFSEALTYLSRCIQKEVQRPSKTVKGDWEPLTFLLMANAPTDVWEQRAKRLRPQLGKVIACVIGPDIDAKELSCVTSAITRTEDFQPVYFESYLKWMSQSIINEIAISQKQDNPPQTY